MNVRALLLATLLLSTALVSLAPTAEAATVRLAVFGDDGVTSNTRANVDGALRDGAQGYVGLGDYYYWSAPSDWKSLFKPLTDKGSYLALGNHDDLDAIRELVPNGAATWTRSVNGVRFVALDSESRMDPGTSQHTKVRGWLCGASEPVRVLLTHKNWWLGSGARHPGTEFPASASAMDALVKDCGVDLVLASHEHNYQRMMRGGVPYLIVGTGGQSLYDLNGIPSGTVAKYKGYGRLLLDVHTGGFSAKFRSLDGTTRDAFSYAVSGTGSGTPAVSFAPYDGSEWWVQTKVSGADASKVVKVEARDTGDAWVALTKRSWGAWAASFRVEVGHTVEYRATLSDGRTVTSCAYKHPTGGCASAGSSDSGGSTFDATFRNVRGNDWWVETDVSVTGGTLAGVDARSDGGSWVALTKRSWGSWAKSLDAGSRVEFRARSTTGATDVSAAYSWPPA